MITRIKNSGVDLLPAAVALYLIMCAVIIIYLIVNYFRWW